MVGTAVDITLSCTDGNGNPLQPTVSQPARGSVVMTGNRARYTPNAGVSGTDTFTYTANLGRGAGSGRDRDRDRDRDRAAAGPAGRDPAGRDPAGRAAF